MGNSAPPRSALAGGLHPANARQLLTGAGKKTSGQVLVNRQRARQTLQAEKSKLPSSPLIRPSARANVL